MTNSLAVETALQSAPGVPLDPERAWRAVVARDPKFASTFLYAVVTTGIYCRPGCASRAPRRENVRFFGSAADAEADGFRACKRCRPEGDRPSAAERDVARACAYLDAHVDETVTLAQLARAVHVSPTHLQRTFKRHTGLTPLEYVQMKRMARFKRRLRSGDTVSRATYEAGYGSASRVYEQAAAHLGMTPATYRRGGKGERIRFATVPTALGWLLVAATDRGVCAVSMGNDVAALESDLMNEYPRADVAPENGALRGWVEDIIVYLNGGDLRAIPLDVHATTFQWRVWKALQAIPRGTTRSYSDIAGSMGSSRSARAVARACASNPVALLIPCHRVVRQDHTLGGYRWGIDRKLRLLELEGAELATAETGPG